MIPDLKDYLEKGHSKQKLIYIASPYYHTDPSVVIDRVDELKTIVHTIMHNWNGKTPFSPILNTLGTNEVSISPPPMGWYAYNLTFLDKCDEMWIIKQEGWNLSIGIAIETTYAELKGIPIYKMSTEMIQLDEVYD